MQKPYSEAAQQNREAILNVLKIEFKDSKSILEVGSGSGQHAVHFADQLNHLNWQPSDKNAAIAGMQLWINEANLSNLSTAIVLDVCEAWPQESYDGMFAANVAHIMHWHEIKAMFAGVGQALITKGIFCLYGPFNKNGKYTSDSNQRFDAWLKDRDPNSGIRDINELNKLAKKANLTPGQTWEMPANNFILTWHKN